jgi:hypothetical protein
MNKYLLFLLLGFSYTYAQQSVNSSGGEGTGTGGNFSFSVGQLDYVSASGSNGSVSQGVQQPFEIFVLGTDEIPEISLELSIYPNPTTDVLFIKNKNTRLEFNYQLFDITGKLIASSSKMVQVDQIDMTSLVSGTYLLHIQANNNSTKSFKIIKK